MTIEFFENFFKQDLSFLNLKKIKDISTDSRSISKDSIFVALKGEAFDGNRFALEALKKGAALAVVDDLSLKETNEKRLIFVENALSTFQAMGVAWQNHVNPKVLGITGSNGKTTSKFFTAQLLQNFFKTSFAPQSFNNCFGVPITQLRLKETDEVLVAEIGTNSPGEIQELTDLVSPEICVVTTVGSSHIENFGSLEAIALEKQEIYKSSKAQFRIFNLDNAYTRKMYESHSKDSGKRFAFSTTDEKADVFVQASQKSIGELSLKGHIGGVSFDKSLKLFGVYNVYNIMTACSFALALEVAPEKIIEHMESFKTPWGRSEVVKSSKGIKILFDGYNANAQSTNAVLEAVQSITEDSPLHIFLGEMLELGEQASELHYELGFKAASLNPKSICFLGASYKDFKKGVLDQGYTGELNLLEAFDEEAVKTLTSQVFPGERALLKASRGTEIERFLPGLGVSEEHLKSKKTY